MPTEIREGQTATSKDGKSRVVFKGGQWVKDTTYQAPAAAVGGAKTSADDRKALLAAQSRSAAERDAMRQYGETRRAVDRISGPTYASWLDAITPKPDGGWLDAIGGTIGAIPRMWTDDKNLSAMDQLNTVSAQTALKGSAMMKGSSSDKDTALMRLAGVGPYKTQAENRRLIDEAMYQSGLEQFRASATSKWVAKYGSLSAPDAMGRTFESELQRGEGIYADRLANRKRKLPSAPPKRSSGGTVTIDLEGNPVR